MFYVDLIKQSQKGIENQHFSVCMLEFKRGNDLTIIQPQR